MAKSKYLGENAVLDLYDILLDNFITREELEEREQNLSSSVQVGCAFIAGSILKLAEAVGTLQGGEGGVNDKYVATDSEVDDVLKQYFGDSVDTIEVEQIYDEEGKVDDEKVATDDEVDEVLNKYFKKENIMSEQVRASHILVKTEDEAKILKET